MESVFKKLRSLQDILYEKYEIEKQIVEIPKSIDLKKDILKRLKRTYIERNESSETARKTLSNIKVKLQETESAHENLQKQMDLVKTQREYEALDKEIREANEKEQHLRREVVRKETERQALVEALERDEALIKEQEDELQTEETRVDEEIKNRRENLAELLVREQEIVPGMDEEILFKFGRIIRSKSGLGIVPVKKSVCTGCRMILPAQFENDVRNAQEILFCPYCSRILYYSEDEAELIKEEEEIVTFDEVDYGHFADENDTEL